MQNKVLVELSLDFVIENTFCIFQIAHKVPFTNIVLGERRPLNLCSEARDFSLETREKDTKFENNYLISIRTKILLRNTSY